MLLQPKKTKYRKPHNVKYDGKAKGNTYLAFGKYGLIATEGNWLTNNQIEAARIVISRTLKRVGKLWIRVFPHMSKTKKPVEVRMGSGKGAVDKWVAVVKKGTIMFELDNVSHEQAFEALRKAGHKLPLKSHFIEKRNK